jgi:epoxyqueuosine reductase
VGTTDTIESTELTAGLSAAASAAGIDMLGLTSAEPFELREEWGVDQPRDLLPEARFVVVAGFGTRYEPRLLSSEQGRPRGRFPVYGSRVFEQMERHCWDVVGGFLRERGYAALDAPRLPIKPAVVRAGLGRYGKHAVVVTREFGSMIMFACTVTDAPLSSAGGDAPVYAETCPKGCRRCIDACPTGALSGAYTLDRARCITSWLWGDFIPAELRAEQRDRLFGCGECLFACPRNARVATKTDYPVRTDTVDDSPELIPLAAGDRDYYERFTPTFPKRAGWETMRGNALVALGNAGDLAAVETLGRTLADPDPRLRAYSAWSLGRLATGGSRQLLRAALASELVPEVAAEIEAALG